MENFSTSRAQGVLLLLLLAAYAECTLFSQLTSYPDPFNANQYSQASYQPGHYPNHNQQYHQPQQQHHPQHQQQHHHQQQQQQQPQHLQPYHYATPYAPPSYPSPFINSFASAVPGASANSISTSPVDAVAPSYEPPQPPQQPPQPPQQPLYQPPQPPQQEMLPPPQQQQPQQTPSYQPPTQQLIQQQPPQQQQQQQPSYQPPQPQQPQQPQLPSYQPPQLPPMTPAIPTASKGYNNIAPSSQQPNPFSRPPSTNGPSPSSLPQFPSSLLQAYEKYNMKNGGVGAGGPTGLGGPGLGGPVPAGASSSSGSILSKFKQVMNHKSKAKTIPLTKGVKKTVDAWATQMGYKAYYESHGCIDPSLTLRGGQARTAAFAMMLGCHTQEAHDSCQLAQMSQGGAQAARTRMMMGMMLPKEIMKMFEHCLTPSTLMSGMSGFMSSFYSGAGGGFAPPAGAAKPNGEQGANIDCSMVSQMLMMSPSAAEGGMFSPESMENIGILRNKYLPMTCQENLIFGKLPYRLCCPGTVKTPSMQEVVMMRGMGGSA